MNKLRKKYQRKLNKLIRDCNKSLMEDELILGRFYVKQIASSFYEFEDKSGGYLFTYVRCYDKKTRQFKDYVYEYAPWITTYIWRLYMDIVNKFIVEDIGARICTEKTEDFRNVKIPEQIVRRGEYCFHEIGTY